MRTIKSDLWVLSTNF
uniref:Uncharacterized protein n=1 Tax=Lepeophtheirus salmonis TaxID=72036 RepID=A0A0K2TJR2_LEPSM